MFQRLGGKIQFGTEVKEINEEETSISIKTGHKIIEYSYLIVCGGLIADGSLVHDFLFAETEHSFHGCNAPSPAATSAMPIGSYLSEKVKAKFGL